jgi:translation initiation factor 1
MFSQAVVFVAITTFRAGILAFQACYRSAELRYHVQPNRPWIPVMSNNSRLVYSTETGRIKEDKNLAPSQPKGDGIVRIRRETAGRNGKGVTTISGVPLDDEALKKLAKQLKQLCGTGGSLKDGVIEIQGDMREKLKADLEKRGFTVKLAGG